MDAEESDPKAISSPDYVATATLSLTIRKAHTRVIKSLASALTKSGIFKSTLAIRL